MLRSKYDRFEICVSSRIRRTAKWHRKRKEMRELKKLGDKERKVLENELQERLELYRKNDI